MKVDRRELAGAVADVGVLVPIAVALIVGNARYGGAPPGRAPLPDGGSGLPTAGARSAAEGFGAIAIAKGLGSDEIAAGALLMGVIFIVLGRLGLLDLAARGFPRAPSAASNSQSACSS